MSANVDNRPASGVKAPFQNCGVEEWAKLDVDFSAAGNGLATDETMALMDFEADELVRVAVKVKTGDANITDFDMGLSADGSANNELLDGKSLATADVWFVSPTIGKAAAMQLVAVNKTAAQTCNVAILEVWVGRIATGNLT